MAPLLEERGGGGAAQAGFAIGGFALGGLVYSALVTWMLRRLGIGRILLGGGFFAGAALLILGLGGDWTLDAAVQYSPDIKRTVRSIVGARYSPGPFRTVGATYRLTRG